MLTISNVRIKSIKGDASLLSPEWLPVIQAITEKAILPAIEEALKS